MLADAVSRAGAESHKCERMQVIALVLPALRSELLRIFVKSLIIVRTHRLGHKYNILGDRHCGKMMLLDHFPHKDPIAGAIVPSGLIHHPIQINNLLQIFSRDILIAFDILIDLLP